MALVFAVMQLYNILIKKNSSVYSPFILSLKKKNLVLINRLNGPRLMCFSNRANTEGTNSSKILCFDVCEYFVLRTCVSGPIMWFWVN